MTPINQRIHKLKPSDIRKFSALAKTVPGCVMLTLGEPDLDTPEEVKQAAVSALDQNMTHYAANQGDLALRTAIAEYETRRGMPTNASQIIVTVGATEALSCAMESVLDPDDEVIVLTPAYPLYDSLSILSSANAVHIDIAKTGFKLTKENLACAISEKTKAIIINSPNNPTGTVLDQESLNNLKNAIVGKNIWLICDACYDQLSYEPIADITLDPDLASQRIVCQSFSKPYAMTGWRIGYLVAPEEVAPQFLLLHAARVSCLPTFIQAACISALQWDPSSSIEIYKSRRDYVLSRLDQMGLSYPYPSGAFYVFVDISQFGMDSATFCTRLIQEGAVATVPGSCFGSEGFLRLSYCCSMEQLKLGLDRLEAFIHQL